MDEARQRLLEKELGDRLRWQKPEIVETVGPFDPAVFDRYEAQLTEAIDLLRSRLEGYTDAQIAVLAGEDPEDPDGLRKEWRRLSEPLRRQSPPWYAGGFGHPDHRADLGYWRLMPDFSLAEATCLSVGIDPKAFDEPKLESLAKRRDRDTLWPPLQYILKRHELLRRKFGGSVAARHFFLWAEANELEMPPEFRPSRHDDNWPNSSGDSERTKPAKPDKREIDTIAQLFTAIAIDSYGYDPTAKRGPIPKEIADLAAKMGLKISTDTVRTYLRRGAAFIPEDWKPEVR